MAAVRLCGLSRGVSPETLSRSDGEVVGINFGKKRMLFSSFLDFSMHSTASNHSDKIKSIEAVTI